jgi:hypothetical protein
MAERHDWRDYVDDPADAWGAEMTTPIPRLIGGLVTLALLFGLVAWGIETLGSLIFLVVLGVGYAIREIVPAVERLPAFRRYEAWLAAPAPPPRHLGARIAGTVLIAVIVIELFLVLVQLVN